MKLQIVNGAHVATSENEADAIALVKLMHNKPATEVAVVSKQFPKHPLRKYNTVAELNAAKARYSRNYYRRTQAAKRAAQQEAGTPVAINQI